MKQANQHTRRLRTSAFLRAIYRNPLYIKITTIVAKTMALARKKPWFGAILLSLPIIAYCLPLLATRGKITPGDPDWYFQIYEAFRRDIIEFGQFPGWNPWMAGGIPLFANVQLGAISVQTPFVLAFGAVAGLKLAVVAYLIICFFGCKKLFKDGLGASPLRAILLSYILTFSSFFMYRVMVGHFTFMLVAFVPWLFYLYLKRSQKRNWLWFALIYSLMVWSSPHYTTIMTAVVIGLWFGYDTIARLYVATRSKKWRDFGKAMLQDTLFFAKAGAVIIALCAYRMYFALEFIKDFPRYIENSEVFTGIYQGWYAIWGPYDLFATPQLNSKWSWEESAAYIGFGTFICLLIVLGVAAKKIAARKKPPFSVSLYILLALLVTMFLFGMGDFGDYSPYHLLSQLPFLNSMRVAPRWLLWAGIMSLCIIAAYQSDRFKKTINIILALTVCELFITGALTMPVLYRVNVNADRTNGPFNQEIHYRTPRPQMLTNEDYMTRYVRSGLIDENLYEATRNNIGQIIAGDSLVDTRQPNSTIRCGFSMGNCDFISSNATISYWSPNKIVIKRTAEGDIKLNMNPGRGWTVNGAYVFANYKVTDPLKDFIVTDPSETITLEYAPQYSPTWLLHKIGL